MQADPQLYGARHDWKHPDVEAAINRHPRLHQQMRNPHLIHIMKWFHDDPEGFMQHFEENDEELIFIKDLLEIMDDTKLGRRVSCEEDVEMLQCDLDRL
eukprot:g19300.t1